MSQRCGGPICNGAEREDSAFGVNNTTKSGRQTECKECKAARAILARKARVETRLRSDTEPLRPEDFQPIALGKHDSAEAAERQQFYTKRMGQYLQWLRDPTTQAPVEMGGFVGGLAEAESRFQRRRLGRSLSLQAANEGLLFQQFKDYAERVLKGKVVAKGYARKRVTKAQRRILTALFTDLHLGARLPSTELPEGFDEHQERRRLAWVVQQAADWKPQYRDETTLHVDFGGDEIEGMLLHDMRDGAPLAEQMVAFVRYACQAIAYLASARAAVHVYCVPGNHERNRLRHPGRATSSKWDGFGWIMYHMIAIACRDLQNVTFTIPKTPYLVIPLFSANQLLVHGDTEPLDVNRPSSFETFIAKANGNNTYGKRIDLLTCGHFHEAWTRQFETSSAIVNGALVPPNGHARAKGYSNGCGQTLFESVEGHPFGDYRFIRVGAKQDADASLDAILSPLTF